MPNPLFCSGWDFKLVKPAVSLAAPFANGACLLTNINYTVILRAEIGQQNGGKGWQMKIKTVFLR